MAVKRIVIIVCALSVARARITDIEDAKAYLKNDSLTDFKSAIMDLQQRGREYFSCEIKME